MFQGKTFVILTGASKGFGQALACSLAREFSKDNVGKESVLVLVARSKEGLETTRSMVAKISSDLTVHAIPGDLSDLTNVDAFISSIFEIDDSKLFSSAVLINNAGSLGSKIKSIPNHTDVEEIRKYMDFNITSSVYLTSRFLNHFSTTKNYVIQISSLCAVEATPSLPLYCTGKAARDMFNKVLALESKDVRVLNYAPGPMDTEMYDEIMNKSDSEPVRKMFVEMKEEDKVLKPETSADKLVCILKEDSYESGAHIDYFDKIPWEKVPF